MQRRDFLFLATAATAATAATSFPQVASAQQPAAKAKLTADDYTEIQQLYARYPHAIDGVDAEGYAALFTPDGSFGNNVGHDALVKTPDGRRFKTRVNKGEAGSGNPASAATAAVTLQPFIPIRP